MKVDMNKFYERASYEQPHELRVKVKGYSDMFDVELVGRDQAPDCNVGHFGYNWYKRTKYGCKAKRYASLKLCFRSIKKLLGDMFEGIYIVRGHYGRIKKLIYK